MWSSLNLGFFLGIFVRPLSPFQQLSIPRAFLKHLVDEMSEEGEATLMIHRCAWKSWHVKDKGFLFYKGSSISATVRKSTPQPSVAIPMEAQRQENDDRQDTEEEIKSHSHGFCQILWSDDNTFKAILKDEKRRTWSVKWISTEMVECFWELVGMSSYPQIT
ncbi:hypothetical protein NE237_030332 [Protea cynaroides]|uniref:Uncharacterized protein n=1 Tax=Protea cynaroides TaxID=273540 RepID=A0A9Q0GVY9_9MAGN|nr:hypothetical protein NE237_030332 [Protea cynaroides]